MSMTEAPCGINRQPGGGYGPSVRLSETALYNTRCSGTVVAVDLLARNSVVVGGKPEGRAMVFAHGFGCDQQVRHGGVTTRSGTPPSRGTRRAYRPGLGRTPPPLLTDGRMAVRAGTTGTILAVVAVRRP